MEVPSECKEFGGTPSISYNGSIWRSEDSGYHTSYTPGSIDCSHTEISNENLDPTCAHGSTRISGQFGISYVETPEPTLRLGVKYVRAKKVLADIQSLSTPSPPIEKRGVKRAYPDAEEVANSVPTPTTAIAGEIQKLKVTESIRSIYSNSSVFSDQSKSLDIPNHLDHLSAHNLSYPTTPIKRICKIRCKLSPMKRSNKKLNFTTHSLSCEGNEGVVKQRPHQNVVRSIEFRPGQKIDIVKMLFKNVAMPPLMKIINYLSYEDICRFKSVSFLWCEVWNQVSRVKKQELEKFLRNEKDNQENRRNSFLRKNSDSNQQRSLKEVHNLLNTEVVISSSASPPASPRSNKFRKFTKNAHMDPRLQLSCVRCCQPAKVTVEVSGEEWAECTSVTCSYNFCKFCKCERHPGKICFKYDLDGPSPSKRKKNANAICTKKSRKNLYRLMI